MLRFIFGLFAALAISAAQAQPVPATDPIPRVAFPISTVGNISTIGPRTADAANAAKFSFGVAANGAVFANTGDRLPTPGGASIPIGVSGTIAKPNVAAALGRFARKTLPLLSVGSALYDLGQELGFTLDNSSGNLVVTTPPDPALFCTVGPCYTYYVQVPYYIGGGTATAVCKAALAAVSSPSDVVVHISNTSNQCLGQRSSNGFNVTIPIYNGGSRPPDVAENQPSSVQAFEDAIAAKSGWFSSSALARATVDAIKAGESLQVEPETITGPATSPGPASSTHNVTNNTTTIVATTHHHTYAGPQITTTTVTNRSTIDNSTSTVINEEEIVETPVVPEPQASDLPCGVSGLSPCNVKVDETGTPSEGSASSRLGQAVIDLENVQGDAESALGDVDDITLPEWTWTFSFPTGCTPLVLSAYDDLSIDVCQWQPVIHDIMSVLWVIAGIWGLIHLFMRTTGV